MVWPSFEGMSLVTTRATMPSIVGSFGFTQAMRNMNATAQQNRRRRTSPNMVKLLKSDGEEE
jgi:hypothetical protein